MLYAIISQDIEDSRALRQANRPAHLERLEQLQAEGRLVLAGPCPGADTEEPGPAGFTGSLVVAEFDSLEAAEAWARSDPYQTGGVYARVTVKPFKKVFPK